MLSSTLTLATAFLGLAAGYAIPNSDGFPNPSAAQTVSIEKLAGGVLSNQIPMTLNPKSLTVLQLVAINEQFEVAYFSSLIDNVTNHVAGFNFEGDWHKEEEILNIMKVVKAQEEMHALTATALLTKFGSTLVPQPCTYKFPTTNLHDAVELASNFTAVVLGTLQDASQAFATNGDFGLVRAFASVIGNEAEQEGFYRFLLNKQPSEKPFLTTSVAPYAWSVLRTFIETCPFDINSVPIPSFPLLNVATRPSKKDANLTFTADLSSYGTKYGSSYDSSKLWITYLTGQQAPIVVPVHNVKWTGSQVSVDALFPYVENVMDGLTLVALTNSSNFTGPDDLPASTIAAPGIIQINEHLDRKL